MAKHRVVEVPASNLKKEITKILFEKGYILNYKFVEDGPQGTIKIALKYDTVNKVNAIKKLIRISTPGMRKYTGYKDMPRVRDFRGINPNAFDGRGNYAMGVKEQLIFPEIEYDKIDKVRGMDIIFVTTAKTDEEARELLTLMGAPFAR